MEHVGIDLSATPEDSEFRQTLGTLLALMGVVATSTGSYPIAIEIGTDFPFAPPSVWPASTFPSSWHRERIGRMCLYPAEDRGGLPWLDVSEFLALVTRWFAESERGWPGDLPVLDLERYFFRSNDRRLVLFDNLEGLTWVRFKADARTIQVQGSGTKPRGGRKDPSGAAFGYVVQVGEVSAPPTTWDDISGLMNADSHIVEGVIRERRISILLVRYSRAGSSGLVALEVFPDAAGSIGIRSLRSASTAARDLNLRAGFDAPTLRQKSALVVGAGAVGSFLADSLARAGIGKLAIQDGDVLRPGNLVRHLASEKHIGLMKTEAVRLVIESYPFGETDVVSIPSPLALPREAADVVSKYDLVIDATANGGVTALLHHAALAVDKHVLTVCLKENGSVARVDILPPLRGEALRETLPSQKPSLPNVYETGCGDPVSLTTHAAVIEAASLAARHALALLTGQPLSAAGVERDYRGD